MAWTRREERMPRTESDQSESEKMRKRGNDIEQAIIIPNIPGLERQDDEVAPASLEEG